jgi:hypothetical protein
MYATCRWNKIKIDQQELQSPVNVSPCDDKSLDQFSPGKVAFFDLSYGPFTLAIDNSHNPIVD